MDAEKVYLVIGIGNPGEEYELTRHNVGFDVVDEFAKRVGAPRWERKYRGLVSQVEWEGRQVVLLKPMTFVNLSGESVSRAVQALGLPLEKIMVVTDDLNLPVGRLRIRRKGSSGGHRGLKSIEQALGTNKYPRLRIGIGPGPTTGSTRDFVLSPFRKSERQVIDIVIEDACAGLETWIREGIEAAMNLVNAIDRREEQ